ncbi:hypothetical protein PVK06_026999 [Gossypium arboreum]|uniref:Uncharacterized protein n=1 Tax=Gossypium arboreum TaxID=29729 RepID=A0ABR0P2M9_GOSAR|nr:hypothetical protein PVK06_026999 [Gossypium arboreum]
MAKTRGSVKKATKSVGEHASSATIACESESPRPVQIKELVIEASYVMLLCQQREIVPYAGEEVLENKGPINKASVERMTQGNDTLILKEAKTSKIRKGKAKVDRKGINLNIETTLWRKLKDVEKMDIVVEKKVAAAKEEVVT